jgi:hypothetical protein
MALHELFKPSEFVDISLASHVLARALLSSTVSRHTDTFRHERLDQVTMQPLTQDIIHIISQKPGCLLDEITLVCPEVTWNQVLGEIDH